MNRTGISYANYTVNPYLGCEKVGVKEGLWSFEEAMIPAFGLLPDQRTVREALLDQVDGFLAHGRIPLMLPPGPAEG